MSCFYCAWLSVTPWTVAHQAPLSMEFFRQEYWSGLPFPPPGDLLNQGTEPRSPSLQADSLPSESPVQFSSVQFRCSVVSDSLQPHESQHARPPCPSPTPGVYTKSCPSSQWCHPAISFSVIPFSSWPQSLPASGSFPMSQLFASSGQVLEFQLNISPSNEHPGLISFRMDWLDVLAVQRTEEDSQEASPTLQFKSINSSALSFPHSPTLTSIHDNWKNHRLD